MLDLKSKLKKTREGLGNPLRRLFARKAPLSPEEREELEELLIGADVGVEASERLLRSLAETGAPSRYRETLRRELLSLLGDERSDRVEDPVPTAVLVVGVNGVGKTTTAAKLAHYYKRKGKKLILAACDTFRAAAVEQLAHWARAVDVQIVSHRGGGDPAAVAYDACSAAKARGAHYVILDTAGRLHTKVNLMEELKKIKRVCEKQLGPGAVRVLLVIDATLGQNSLVQAREFTRSLETTGIVLAKLDSSSRGGIVVAIREALGVGVDFIGIGEGLDDLLEFSPAEFVDALLS